jgi:hypothetical protein
MITYVNAKDEVVSMEIDDFECIEGGLVKLTITIDHDKEEDEVRYIPIHRFIMADGMEPWVPPDEDEDDDEDIAEPKEVE